MPAGRGERVGRGLPRVSHGGSWAGYRAELMRFPEQRLTVACLCNLGTADPTRLATEVAEIYLGAALAPDAPAAAGTEAEDTRGRMAERMAPAMELSPAELSGYAGRYHRDELDTTYALEVKEGRRVLSGKRVGGALTPTVRDEFTQDAMVLRFERDGQGRPSAFRLGQGRIRNLRFTRSEAP
jgi:hypothetical protein